MLIYPKIDPVCLRFFGFEFYWYSVAYITGVFAGLWLAKRKQIWYKLPLQNDTFDRLISAIVIGILVGGRVGYVLLYAFDEFWINPWYLIEFPIRGMSFHGGFAGVAVALLWYVYRTRTPLFLTADVLACCAPIGLFLGRIANFINAELYGRVTDCWCGMVFPGAGVLPRHPSQLYEALSEGALMFTILNLLYRLENVRKRTGVITGLFISLYGLFRFFVEYAREPSDGYIVIANMWLTLGQAYSLPMIAGGIVMVWLRWRNNRL